MDGRMGGWMDGWMDGVGGWVSGWGGGWVDPCLLLGHLVEIQLPRGDGICGFALGSSMALEVGQPQMNSLATCESFSNSTLESSCSCCSSIPRVSSDE